MAIVTVIPFHSIVRCSYRTLILFTLLCREAMKIEVLRATMQQSLEELKKEKASTYCTCRIGIETLCMLCAKSSNIVCLFIN